MDGGDLYKNLLTTAARAQQQRHAQIHDRLVGNVYLPALHPRSNKQSELSLKHLAVIEQCILAENRREEQLARCASDKERRYLTKRFQAQRQHERDLVEALMLGKPTDRELEIVDVEASRATYVSPLARHAGARGGGGSSVDVGGSNSSPATVGVTMTLVTEPKVLRVDSPKKQRSPSRRAQGPSQKASSSPSKGDRPSHSASPTRGSPKKHDDPLRLPSALASSPLKPGGSQFAVPSPKARSTSPKRRKPPGPGRPLMELQLDLDPARGSGQDDATGSIAAFEGATSFLEARQQAMTILQPDRRVEGATQTTQRTVADEDAARVSGMVLMLTSDLTDHDKMASSSSSTSATAAAVSSLQAAPDTGIEGGSQRVGHVRPHSSPERRRRLSAPLPALSPSRSSDKSLKDVELFRASNAGIVDGVVTFVSDGDHTKRIHLLPRDRLVDVVTKELAWSGAPTDPITTSGASMSETKDEGIQVQGDSPRLLTVVAPLPPRPETATASTETTEELAMAPPLDEQPPLQIEDLENGPRDQEVVELTEDPDVEVTMAVYELVELVVEAQVEEEEAKNDEGSALTERSRLLGVGKVITRIQSAFRGHRARRAFRLALYEEALRCGVLGAMPGTLQGRTGWYQDPKTLLAYYFVVQADDGTWTQKIVLRCRALVLSPYQMHEEILSKVIVGPT